MNIAIAPEVIFHIGQFKVTNTMLSTVIVTIVLLWIALLMKVKFSRIPNKAQSMLELIWKFFEGQCNSIIGNAKVTKELMPYLVTLFIFLLASNYSGLIPGFGTIGIHEVIKGKAELVPIFRAPTSDLNTAMVLATLSMVLVQYFGFKYSGIKGYISHFFSFNLKKPMDTFVGILEFVGEFSRFLSFSFRLFGNILAGEILITVMIFLTMQFMKYLIILPLPFYFMEVFVGLIQAAIFPFLTIVFVSLAVKVGEHNSHEANQILETNN